MIPICYKTWIIVLNLLTSLASFQSDRLIKNSIQIQIHLLRVMKCTIPIKISIIKKKQIKFNKVNQKLLMKTPMKMRIKHKKVINYFWIKIQMKFKMIILIKEYQQVNSNVITQKTLVMKKLINQMKFKKKSQKMNLTKVPTKILKVLLRKNLTSSLRKKVMTINFKKNKKCCKFNHLKT